MSLADRWTQGLLRTLARRSSRRGFLGLVGGILTSAAMLPLLPQSRAAGLKSDDASRCEYWRYCALHGRPCSACGGSTDACPAGSTAAPHSWLATCRNPGDDNVYVISYNDCCGGRECHRAACASSDPQTVFRPQLNATKDACTSLGGLPYTCSTAIALGRATT